MNVIPAIGQTQLLGEDTSSSAATALLFGGGSLVRIASTQIACVRFGNDDQMGAAAFSSGNYDIFITPYEAWVGILPSGVTHTRNIAAVAGFLSIEKLDEKTSR